MNPILVVDDDPQIRSFMQRVLTKAGHTVVLAADPEEAWEHFQSRTFALVVTDWKMPKGGGEKLIDQITASASGVPILVVSSEPRLVSRKPAWGAQPVQVLGKPLDVPAFMKWCNPPDLDNCRNA